MAQTKEPDVSAIRTATVSSLTRVIRPRKVRAPVAFSDNPCHSNGNPGQFGFGEYPAGVDAVQNGVQQHRMQTEPPRIRR